MTTIAPYHAKYFAHYLTRRLPANNRDKLTASLHDAQVDLTPHQIDAALFAFKSPLSNGAILADEVGLGKTIEAGIILSQQWAEHKRRLLIICPANLRKQWSAELMEKFFLPSAILETKTFNQEIEKGNFREDLYHRLSVIVIQVPPLRERKDDVPLLVSNFLEIIAQDMGKPVPTFEAEALEALKQYQWTGNIRELHNIVERLVILCGSTITKDDVVRFGNPLN